MHSALLTTEIWGSRRSSLAEKFAATPDSSETLPWNQRGKAKLRSSTPPVEGSVWTANDVGEGSLFVEPPPLVSGAVEPQSADDATIYMSSRVNPRGGALVKARDIGLQFIALGDRSCPYRRREGRQRPAPPAPRPAGVAERRD